MDSRTTSHTALIGRRHPAGVLRAEIARAAESHGGLVLVTGEAGIGKTTLVSGAAEQAKRLGALVLSGSCWDSDSAPGYWPWVQVIRGLRRGVEAGEWAAVAKAAGGSLAVLLGESPSTEGTDSFELYDAVTTALVSASQRRPVVVVLDDLHWADNASVRLLEFAARHTWFERLLLVGTYRDVEVDTPGHPLRPLLTPLVARATTVTLTGLDRDEVGALMARTVGQEPAPDLVAEVHRRTGGNPFFVEQTARLWHSGGSASGVAPGVRDAVQRRLSLLPAPVGRLLTAAALLGREFDCQVLAAAAATPEPAVGRLLDQAVTARLVVTTLEPGRFAFAHDLVRETLYAALDEADARRQHAAIVRALDSAPALGDRVLPAELARHAHLAGADLPPSRAVEILLAAGQDASGRLASEEAAGHYRRALELTDLDRQRATISLALGQEVHHLAERADTWRHFADAVAAARRAGDPELLARVAITLLRYSDPGHYRPLQDAVLREAHAGLVRAGAVPDADAPAERLLQELIEHVSALARRGADDEGLAFGLSARHDTIWGPGTAREREALTEEIEAVARRRADRDLEQYAASLRWVALLEQGDPRYLDQYRAYEAMAERFGTARFSLGLIVDRSIMAALWGDFAAAEALLDGVPTGGHGHAEFLYMIHQVRWALWLRQGRFAELDALLGALTKADHSYLPLLTAITAVEKGDHESALRYLAEVGEVAEPVPRPFLPLWLRLQAQVAAVTRDPVRCERARAALTPYRGEWAVSMYGCDIGGPVDLWIAVVDAAQERWAEAIAGFTAARDSADRLRARSWSVEARAGLAAALLGLSFTSDAGAAADAAAAAALLDEVEREAAELGMPQIVDRVRAVRAGKPARPRPAQVFRRDGAVWSLAFAGRSVHLPDAKGLRDLYLLVSRPGTDIPAVELLSPEGGHAVVAARRMGGDPILDEEAKTRFKRRLGQLDEEIDRAAERGDDRRAADLDRERQALLDELRAAAGLAGRTRRLGDDAERARKAVTARIRDALRKLDQRHPELAAHLRAAVSTGATCRYQPDRAIDWRL
jgi:hypothetical protein